MAADAEIDRSRAVVKTYVPAYQKTEWARHADQLGMSHSEYVRTMVQAGRRGFGAEADRRPDGSGPTESPDSKPDPSDGSETNPSEPSPVDDEASLEQHVLSALADGRHQSWDELIETVTDDIEGRLERVLESLQSTNRVTHSGRNGGYVLVEDRER